MKHQRDFTPSHGIPVEILPGIRRLTANNPGPFTFHGTNSYLVGTSDLTVVDPGPANEAHIAAILEAAEGAKIDTILVTHTHMDHSPGAKLLQAVTGAPIVGCGPHVSARDLMEGEINLLDASGDKTYRPDVHLHDGETYQTASGGFEAIATPGHIANHLCFAISGTDLILSGDHVMAWATSIVAPPDGSMKDYMASLDVILARPENQYLPGHGGPVENAHEYVNALKDHRLAREASIVNQLKGGSHTIPQIVDKLYADVDPALHGAAGLSVFAHLEDLLEKGEVSCDPGLAISARYSLSNKT